MKKYPLLGLKKDFSDRIRLGYENAERAASFLKNEYSATRVLLFGSLLTPKLFHETSDIDIAVEGLPEEYFYQSVGAVMNLMDDFNIDIVDLDACKPELKKRIMQEYIEL